MVVPRSLTAFLLTGVVATVAGLLIERYIPDNRKAPIYSTTTEDPNKEVFEEIDWLKRVQGTASLVQERGAFYRCFTSNYDYKIRTVTLECTDVRMNTKARFDHVRVD